MASKLSRNSRSYSEGDINKRREENTSLRKTLDEVSDHKGAPSVSQDNHVYLERILSLETLREKNSQQILARDQEIAYLWQMIRSDTVTSLHTQIIQLRAEAEIRETLYHSLKQETEEVKKKVEAVLQQTSKIHLSAKDLQDLNHENQHLQRQLHRVLKKLQKALEKVVILESEKERETSSSASKAYADLERVPKESPPSFSSSPGSLNLLDKSFLECPVCRVKYPTNGHRELLVHIDHCFGTD